jgi:hypothetical protein
VHSAQPFLARQCVVDRQMARREGSAATR